MLLTWYVLLAGSSISGSGLPQLLLEWPLVFCSPPWPKSRACPLTSVWLDMANTRKSPGGSKPLPFPLTVIEATVLLGTLKALEMGLIPLHLIYASPQFYRLQKVPTETSWLVFVLTCSVNCGIFYTAGVCLSEPCPINYNLPPVDSRISRIKSNRMHLTTIWSAISKGTEYLCTMRDFIFSKNSVIHFLELSIMGYWLCRLMGRNWQFYPFKMKSTTQSAKSEGVWIFSEATLAQVPLLKLAHNWTTVDPQSSG